MSNFRKVIAGIVVGSTAALAVPTLAQAGPMDHWHGGYYQPNFQAYAYHEALRQKRRKDRNAAIALGVAGAVLGTMVLNNVSRSRSSPPYYGQRYVAPSYAAPGYATPRYRYPPDYYTTGRGYRTATPKPVYDRTAGNAWIGSDDWHAYCRDRYRTFDPATGTFMSNSGVRKLCK